MNLFKWTGKGTLVIELEDCNPMIIEIDDEQLMANLIQTVLDEVPDLDVFPYGEKTRKRAKKLLNRK
jgi:hypothetical protein